MAKSAVAAAVEPVEQGDAEEFRRRITFIAIGMMVVVLAYPDSGIGKIPLRFLLKDQLHLEPHMLAYFFTIVNLPSWCKILIGIVSDTFPLFGTRRRNYVLLASVTGMALWGVMALIPKSFLPLLVVGLALNAMATVCGTMHGAVVMEEGNRHGATGRIISIRSVFSHIAALIGAPLGGYLAGQALGWTCAAGAMIFLVMVVTAYSCLHESPTARPKAGVGQATWNQMKMLGRSKMLWAAGGLMFLVQVAPGFSTPLFFYQTDSLHFSGKFIGILGGVGSGCSIVSGFVYFFLCRRFKLRQVITICISLNVAGAAAYLAYHTPVSAFLIDGLYGLAGSLGYLCLFDLTARATPKGSEAVGYSVMMVFVNLAMAGSDIIGSNVYELFHKQFAPLVPINAATTALVLLAVPFLPAALVNRRDGEKAA
ncbi:MAG TPA: MFS transporter [Armatimonadota bacterium]